jgi:glutamate 5-kinase
MSTHAPTGTKPLLVVKLGSSSVTKDSGPDTSILADALDQAIDAMANGWQVILVSSGAQSVGRAMLEDGTRAISPKLAAAFGQPILMEFYRSESALRGAQVCQVLIGESDLRSSARMTAIAAVLHDSLAAGIIPIVNGNDPTDDGKTNNDLVAAGIALMTQASHLLLLTDVDGVYEGTPGDGAPLAELHVDGIHAIKSHASGSGTGGIKSKLRAAENAARNGIETRIGSARDHRAIAGLVAGQSVGTLIRAAEAHAGTGSRKWISGGAIARGELSINVEAETSIAKGSSLFASGVKRVKGAFVAGDVVELVSPRGKLLGRGTVRLSSDLLTLIRALKVEDIARVLVHIIRSGADVQETGDTDARLKAALDQFGGLGREARRRLLIEVTGLFPEDTAAALAGTRSIEPAHLVEHYATLVASLAVIHNSYLVEFPAEAAHGELVR